MSMETYNRGMARVDLYKKLAEAEGITTNHLRGTYKMKKSPTNSRGFYHELLNFYRAATGEEPISVTPELEYGDAMTLERSDAIRKLHHCSLFVPKSVLRAQGNCFAAWCHITKGDLILRLRQLSQVRIQRD